MENEPQMNWSVGLADEERKDLEHLIDAFKEDRFSASSPATPEELQKQIDAMKEKMIRISAMLLDLDKKMRSLYEVFRLFHRKTEVMNQRINDLARLVKIGKKR